MRKPMTILQGVQEWLKILEKNYIKEVELVHMLPIIYRIFVLKSHHNNNCKGDDALTFTFMPDSDTDYRLPRHYPCITSCSICCCVNTKKNC